MISGDLTKLDRFRIDVMRRVSQDERLRRAVCATNDAGHRAVVVAEQDERLAVLMRRVTAAGGYATAFVDCGKTISVVSFVDSSCALGSEQAVDMASVPVGERPSPNASVGMFITYLRRLPHGVLLRTTEDAPPPMVSTRDLEGVPV